MKLIFWLKRWYLLIIIILLIYSFVYIASIFSDGNQFAAYIQAIIMFFSVLMLAIQINNEIIKEDKIRYNRLIAILFEMRLFIIRCEAFLDKQKEGKKHYNKIKMTYFNSQMPLSLVSDIPSDIYNAIKNVYYGAEVIADNISRAEIVNTYHYTSANELPVIRSQDNEQKWILSKIEYQNSDIDDKRYGVALAFVRCYLKDIYDNYNVVSKETKKYALKKGYYFPDKLKCYEPECINSKVSLYQLEDSKLEGH